MGPIWGRQDPGGPRVGPMNLATCSSVHDIITAQCKTAESPLPTHWKYCSLVLSHRCVLSLRFPCCMQRRFLVNRAIPKHDCIPIPHGLTNTVKYLHRKFLNKMAIERSDVLIAETILLAFIHNDTSNLGQGGFALVTWNYLYRYI